MVSTVVTVLRVFRVQININLAVGIMYKRVWAFPAAWSGLGSGCNFKLHLDNGKTQRRDILAWVWLGWLGTSIFG